MQNPAGNRVDHRSSLIHTLGADDHAGDALGLPAHAHPLQYGGGARGLGGRRQRSPFWSRVSVSSDFSKTMASRSVLHARVSPPAVTEAMWRTLIMAYDVACVGGHVALYTAQTQRTDAISG